MQSPLSPPLSLMVSHSSSVTADQIDELGHMNVRYYGLNATAGTKDLCRTLGIGEPAVISTYTRHHHEQMEGSNLEVRSAVLGGTDRMRIYHELRNCADDDLAATFVHELDHPAVDHPAIELPDHGKPRSLDLNGDGLASAPTLDEVRARDLAIRHERAVSTEDSLGADVVPSWLANNLIWGGERPGGNDDWIQTTPDGQRMAFATMESRLWIGHLPTVGTRIQSFGAVVDVGQKISHSVNWAYDLDTHAVLAAFETINLAFNITERRSMVIPDNMRDQELERLHADLAVRPG